MAYLTKKQKKKEVKRGRTQRRGAKSAKEMVQFARTDNAQWSTSTVRTADSATRDVTHRTDAYSRHRTVLYPAQTLANLCELVCEPVANPWRTCVKPVANRCELGANLLRIRRESAKTKSRTFANPSRICEYLRKITVNLARMRVSAVSRVRPLRVPYVGAMSSL
eukprot:874407-Prymnesium_polylepis.2